MNRTLSAFVAIILLVTFVQAQEAITPDTAAQPKSLAAKQAETKFNADMQKLDAEYQTRAAAIKKAYVDGLKNTLRTLAQKPDSDSDEIAKLSVKIKEVQDTEIAVPVAMQQAKRISGKWNTGGEWIITVGKNANAIYSHPGEKQRVLTWLQDGSTVYVLCPDGHYDRMVLSKDGKTMNGISIPSNVSVIYTYVGY